MNTHKPDPSSSLALLPKLSGVGGPTSFQRKLMTALNEKGIRTHFDSRDPTTKALLVNGGSKHLGTIWRARKRGIRVVQRLNGMNWIHRKRNTGIRHYLRSEYGNWNLSFIRKHLADQIVYQSIFSKNWWEEKYGTAPAIESVVYNGVDLDFYTPHGAHLRPNDHIRVLMVEGHLGGGHEEGLLNAIRLIVHLSERLSQQLELMVLGEVSPLVKLQIEDVSNAWITWAGIIEPEHIPAFDRSAHILFSADINAACPNSVIEAIACGLPVVAFDTGSLQEILKNDAGRLAAYGADPWLLEPADIAALSDSALKLLNRLPYYRQQARKQAEQEFGLETMVSGYCDALFAE